MARLEIHSQTRNTMTAARLPYVLLYEPKLTTYTANPAEAATQTSTPSTPTIARIPAVDRWLCCNCVNALVTRSRVGPGVSEVRLPRIRFVTPEPARPSAEISTRMPGKRDSMP